MCRLPRCNTAGLSISSYSDLVNHIQQSHLNRAQLCCPIRGVSQSGWFRRRKLNKCLRMYINQFFATRAAGGSLSGGSRQSYRPRTSALLASLATNLAPLPSGLFHFARASAVLYRPRHRVDPPRQWGAVPENCTCVCTTYHPRNAEFATLPVVAA